MTPIEIKKYLYKENPIALLHNVRKDGITYSTGLSDHAILFLVPLNEIGEVIWKTRMEAKLLIRYII